MDKRGEVRVMVQIFSKRVEIPRRKVGENGDLGKQTVLRCMLPELRHDRVRL